MTLVVNIDVPDDVILARVSERWVHLPSGRIYNMSYNRPRVEGFDDQTGEPLTRRPDDNLVSRVHRVFLASPDRFLEGFHSATQLILLNNSTAVKLLLGSR